MTHPISTASTSKTSWIRQATLLFALTFLIGSANAATLNITTQYSNTGGGAGNLNQTTDTINGNAVCAAANTYANGTPGCDMSADPGYTDPNATPLDPSDDIPTGDLIIRTNDVFIVSAGFSWLGNANVGEDEVTLTGTLPAGAGFIWDSLPGFCALPASNISADGKTIVCVRSGFDSNGTGTYAENPPFPVRVEGDATNGSTPGDIVFTISDGVGSASSTDGVASVNGGAVTDAHRLKITASPRWNIDKSANMYTVRSGQFAADGTTPGWWLEYNYTIEVDEVAGEAESGLNPRLGNEALAGGTNATVSFTDDVSAVSPNAELVTWSSNTSFSPISNACDMDTFANGVYPAPSLNAANPERSIALPVGTMAVTCTQAAPGGDVAVTITGVDSSLTNAPTQNSGGGALPVNRAIAAVGLIRIFVPLSDVVGAGGSLVATNCMSEFDPVGLSGTPNFGGNGLRESENDNCRSVTLNANSGSWGKNYRKGWSDQADQITQWGGGSWADPPTDASVVNGGDGTATPDSVWGTYNVYSNNGGTPITNPELCDVIDIETFEMTILDPAADNAGTLVDDRIHAVDLNYSTTESVAGIRVQYATGYVSLPWPPNPTEGPSATAPDEVVDECNIPEAEWFDDIPAAEAAAGGLGNVPVVTKARLVADTLLPGQLMAMRIKHTARSTFLTSGALIPNDTLLVNYATYKSSLTGDVFRANDYIANDATQGHVNATSGDRLIMVRAKVRILKDMTPSGVEPGTDVTVTLSPSFTRDGPQANAEVDNVIIKDLLPIGMTYTNGTTTGNSGSGAAYGEPTVISAATPAECATHVQDLLDQGQSCGGGESILIWDLGDQTSGTVFEDLVFHTIIDIDAPSGVRENYTLIESPADSSPRDIRIANANVINTVPTSLLIVKSVLTPLHEVNTGALLNWMNFRVGLRNGSSAAATGLDVIDILPFNGDGVAGSFTFTPAVGITVPRDRLPAPTDYNGTFEFDDVSMDLNGQCTGTPTYWFTNVDPTVTTLDISPLAPANAIPGGSVAWCGGGTTAAASLAICPFAGADVTAVRVRDIGMDASGTCFVDLTYATTGNLEDDIYSNTAGARVVEVNDAVLSNTVSARVFAGSIGDRVWLDTDGDGIQDGGEPNIPGVTVRLLQADGITPIPDPANPAIDYVVTTDGSGNYLFDNLPAGDYVVFFDTPLDLSPQDAGGNDALDSDADPTAGASKGKTGVITLGIDQDRTDVDAGIITLGAIGDTVWVDLDGDGVLDGGELGIEGATVTLTPPAGVDLGNGAGVAVTTTTDANGNYLFTDLPPGDYTVAVALPAALPAAIATAYPFLTIDELASVFDDDGGNDDTSNLTLPLAGSNLNQDFGFQPLGSIGDTVWVDINNDGVQNPGELGIEGVTVTLFPTGGGAPVVIQTDANGNYLFDNLPAGDYTVAVVLPAALPANIAAAYPDLTIAELAAGFDANGGEDSTSTLTLGVGEDNVDQDFAFTALGSISGTVLEDTDGDDIGDTPIPGVVLELLDSTGNPVLDPVTGLPITTMTDGAGNYTFTGVVPGDYRVRQQQPAGFGSVSDVDGNDTNNLIGDGTPITVTPGGEAPANDFVERLLPPAVDIPTLAVWMQMLLAMLLIMIGLGYTRRRQSM